MRYTYSINPVSYSSFSLSPPYGRAPGSFPFETNSTPRVTQLSCRYRRL
jgi:hypothetical protein